MKIKQLKNVPSALFRYFILIGPSFLILYPIFVTVMISLMQTSDFTNSAVRYLSLSPTLENYKTAAIFLQYGQTLLRSLALNIPLCLLEIVSCMLVAYGFARFKFKGNGILFACVIMTLLIPSSIYFTPFYLSLQDYGPFHWNLLGTPLPLFLMSVCALGVKNGLVIYILRQHFKAYPKELEEAAEIDGAGSFRVFVSIMLPGAMSIAATCFLFIFVFRWTDPTHTNIFLPDTEFIWTRLSNIQTDMSLLPGVEQSDFYFRSILKNTSIVLYAIPLVVLFIFTKRSLVESVETSGLVG